MTANLTEFSLHRLYESWPAPDYLGTLASLFVAGISVLFLAGCATTDPGLKVGSEVETHVVVETQRPSALPKYLEYTERSKMEDAEAAQRAEEQHKLVVAIENFAAEVAARSETEHKLEESAKRAESQLARAPQEKWKVLAIERSTTKAIEGKTAARHPVISQEAPFDYLTGVGKRSVAVNGKPASPEFGADAALLARRDAYLKELKQASYTFNPPSPIKVATPVIVYFWLDPLAEPMRLAEELKAKLLMMRPGEMPQTEAGRMDWSPNMRATLTGEDFDITPTEAKNFDGLKNLSATRRTEWSWDVKAKHVGQQLPLHLRVWTILPQELGEPHEVLKLDKLIHVEVTFLWLVNEYWEKYWKWILGGLGTALAGAIGAWWKTRQTKAAGI